MRPTACALTLAACLALPSAAGAAAPEVTLAGIGPFRLDGVERAVTAVTIEVTGQQGDDVTTLILDQRTVEARTPRGPVPPMAILLLDRTGGATVMSRGIALGGQADFLGRDLRLSWADAPPETLQVMRNTRTLSVEQRVAGIGQPASGFITTLSGDRPVRQVGRDSVELPVFRGPDLPGAGHWNDPAAGPMRGLGVAAGAVRYPDGAERVELQSNVLIRPARAGDAPGRACVVLLFAAETVDGLAITFLDRDDTDPMTRSWPASAADGGSCATGRTTDRTPLPGPGSPGYVARLEREVADLKQALAETRKAPRRDRAQPEAAVTAPRAPAAGTAPRDESASATAVPLPQPVGRPTRRDLEAVRLELAERERQIDLLNAEIRELRKQLVALLNAAQGQEAAADAQIRELGTRLNTALAQRVAETRRTEAQLVEAKAEIGRLEGELATLKAGTGPALDPERPADARAAQALLARAGAYRGPLDGIWGAGSVAALRAWQAAQGLPADGRWTAGTEQRLLAPAE